MKVAEGLVFGRLRVISVTGDRVLCLCACGNRHTVSKSNLLRTSSCGCFRRENITRKNTTHGLSKTSLYRTWKNIKARCYSKNHPHYPYYGGRGITMSEEWFSSFESFYKDMGDKPFKSATIERVDNSSGYCARNCRWASRLEQAKNRRERSK